MSDWLSDQFDAEAAARAARYPTTAGHLFACPPAVPTFDQRVALDRCLAAARGAGLRLPPSFLVRWVEGKEDICSGATRSEDDRIEVALSVFQALPDLCRTAYHELQHVSDLASGAPFDRERWEFRATVFARRMLNRSSW